MSNTLGYVIKERIQIALTKAHKEAVEAGLQAVREEVGDVWGKGAEGVVEELLWAMASPATHREGNAVTYLLEEACLRSGDMECKALDTYDAYSLTPSEKLTLYVSYLKGSSPLLLLEERWNRARARMLKEVREWGCTREFVDDEDLMETHRRLRDWNDPDL